MDTATLDRYFATKGYTVVNDTSAHAVPFYGIHVLATAVIYAVVAPTGQTPGTPQTKYTGDESNLASLSLPVGFYPIRGSSITLTSGTVIIYRE